MADDQLIDWIAIVIQLLAVRSPSINSLINIWLTGYLFNWSRKEAWGGCEYDDTMIVMTMIDEKTDGHTDRWMDGLTDWLRDDWLIDSTTIDYWKTDWQAACLTSQRLCMSIAVGIMMMTQRLFSDWFYFRALLFLLYYINNNNNNNTVLTFTTCKLMVLHW